MSAKTSTNLQTLKLYWHYWMQHPWLFAGSLLLGPAYVLQYVISPFFIARAVGQLALNHAVSWHYIVYTAVSLVGGLGLWFLIDEYCSAQVEGRVIKAMYEDCFKHLLSQDYDFFADNFTGSLVTQANRFVKSYDLFHITIFLGALGQVCAVLVALIIMSSYSLLTGILIAFLWTVSIIIVAFLTVKRIPIRRAAVAYESQQTGELADAITNNLAIKTFASDSTEQARYSETNNKRHVQQMRSWTRAVHNNTAVQIMCAILQIVLLILGVRAVEAGTITIATFLLFEVYIMVIINNVSNTTLTVRQIEGVLGDSHEMTLLFQQIGEVQDPEFPKKLYLSNGAISFENIYFDYKGRKGNSALFKSFNLEVPAGQRVGLVGPSGGGKTTITKLLLRFMDVQSGSINIDGQNIKDILQADLHKAIAYVPQEPLLFHRSLLENIGYGQPGATKDQIVSAAKQAHAHDFIQALPEGYETLVGERGIKLSGGQRQRIAIARAILKKAPILILDEATSALDSESEKYIQESLWKLMEDKTALVIAHRLSTIQHLDKIVVLDNGQIVEQGTHKELLAMNGQYARLWAHQSGGFLEE